MCVRAFLLAWLLAGVALPAAAQQTVHRCVDARAQVTYQAEPCEPASQARQLRLPAFAPPASAPRGSQWPGYKPPKTATLTFYYDAQDQPVGYSTGQMEAAIRDSLAAWSAGCQIELLYGGQRARKLPGSPEHVPIYWEPSYMYLAHPADPRSGIAGSGSLTHGIALKPRFREEHMRPVLVHEVGHVLGLPHNHADPQSIMSYLQDEAARRRAQPSPGDFVDCNVATKRRFGIDYEEPVRDSPRPRMSDREALERIHGPRGEQRR